MTSMIEPAVNAPFSPIPVNLELKRLTPTFGAEILGVDLSAGLTDGLRAAIMAAWREHLVLVIRDQTLSPDDLLSLASGFGTLDLAPPFDNPQSNLAGYPHIAVVSNVEEKGKAIGGLGSGELSWHSDMTYRPKPAVGCVLFAKEIPSAGGNTHFLNMAACLTAIPDATRKSIVKLSLIHDSGYTSAGTPRQQADSFAKVSHPLIVTDPLSGKECLFLGRRRQSAVVGLDEADGQTLLNALWQPAEQGDFALTHVWRPGDVVLWANIAVMHRRDAFNSTERRVLLRAQLAELD